MPVRTRLKVCCIKSSAEAHLAAAAGADIIGLVGPMPSGPGTISYAAAREIARLSPGSVTPWLLTSETQADALIEVADATGIGTLQIVRHIDPQILAAVAAARPQLRLIQVIHVEDASVLGLIDAYTPHVHGFLLDSGKPSAAVETLGGTGDTHDWAISAEFVARSEKPVMLAGGLNAANVHQAVSRVRPHGVDLCSGLRQEDALDENLLHGFLDALKRADLARNDEDSA